MLDELTVACARHWVEVAGRVEADVLREGIDDFAFGRAETAAIRFDCLLGGGAGVEVPSFSPDVDGCSDDDTCLTAGVEDRTAAVHEAAIWSMSTELSDCNEVALVRPLRGRRLVFLTLVLEGALPSSGAGRLRKALAGGSDCTKSPRFAEFGVGFGTPGHTRMAESSRSERTGSMVAEDESLSRPLADCFCALINVLRMSLGFAMGAWLSEDFSPDGSGVSSGCAESVRD